MHLYWEGCVIFSILYSRLYMKHSVDTLAVAWNLVVKHKMSYYNIIWQQTMSNLTHKDTIVVVLNNYEIMPKR